MKPLLLLLSLLVLPFFGRAKSDSLRTVWLNASNPDSARFTALNEYIWTELIFNYPDSAVYYGYDLKKIAEGQKDKTILSTAYNTIGSSYYFLGDLETAGSYYEKLLPLLDYFPNGNGEAVYYGNMANIYFYQDDLEKALSHYFKVLAIFEENDNQRNEATTYNNIGNVYKNQGKPDSAAVMYNNAIQIRLAINDSIGLANSYADIAYVLMELDNPDSAYRCFNRSVVIGDKMDCSDCLANANKGLSKYYENRQNLDAAIRHAQIAYAITKKSHHRLQFVEVAEQLYGILKKKGQYREAIDVHEEYLAMKDSISNDEEKEKVMRLEVKYEFQKKAQADSIKAADAAKIKDAQIAAEQSENRRRQQQSYYLIGGLSIVSLLSLFLFNRFRVTKKQKVIIEEQKEQVDLTNTVLEVKNREILDSINYARRIQSAILPSPHRMNQLLKKSFIYYAPKDIVAGDFYWIEEAGDTILFAVADCTGHGVPGAMVSVICQNALNRSVNEYRLLDPGAILNKTRELVLQGFRTQDKELRDGMDIALCSLKGHLLSYAGAYNPLWLIRNGSTVVEDIKADKQPIGRFEKSGGFTTHTLQLEEGDQIYLFTDGYYDQFGGEEGKKLKTKNFKNLIRTVSAFPIDKQKVMLHDSFIKWLGDFEQVDDVCIMGLRI